MGYGGVSVKAKATVRHYWVSFVMKIDLTFTFIFNAVFSDGVNLILIGSIFC